MNTTVTITTRDDVKKLAITIEALAKEVQSELDNNGDFLSTANELVRNSSTFVFALGEVYALEQASLPGQSVKARVVNANYHNVRDSHGRFTKKI